MSKMIAWRAVFRVAGAGPAAVEEIRMFKARNWYEANLDASLYATSKGWKLLGLLCAM